MTAELALLPNVASDQTCSQADLTRVQPAHDKECSGLSDPRLTQLATVKDSGGSDESLFIRTWPAMQVQDSLEISCSTGGLCTSLTVQALKHKLMQPDMQRFRRPTELVWLIQMLSSVGDDVSMKRGTKPSLDHPSTQNPEPTSLCEHADVAVVGASHQVGAIRGPFHGGDVAALLTRARLVQQNYGVPTAATGADVPNTTCRIGRTADAKS